MTDQLHHHDGTHRWTAPNTHGRELAAHEQAIRAHVADGHTHQPSPASIVERYGLDPTQPYRVDVRDTLDQLLVKVVWEPDAPRLVRAFHVPGIGSQRFTADQARLYAAALEQAAALADVAGLADVEAPIAEALPYLDVGALSRDAQLELERAMTGELPTEEMVNDWNIHNDHAAGNEEPPDA